MDGSAARCHLRRRDWPRSPAPRPRVGAQGFVTLVQQIARTVLGVEDVLLAPPDTSSVGSAGSTSASRQTWMSGGAVEKACRAVRASLLLHVALAHGVDSADLDIVDGRIVSSPSSAGDMTVDVAVAEAAPGVVFEEEVEYHHRTTHPLDEDGQGDAHVSLVCAAHRAVVDVDPDLGLIRVVQIATGQDVGKALNPLQVTGQIEGGIAQGLGLATMEELTLAGGRMLNPSFTDYLIPTALPTCPEVVGHPARGAGAGRPVRGQGGGRTTDHLLHPGHRGGAAGRHRQGADPGAGAPPRHRPVSSLGEIDRCSATDILDVDLLAFERGAAPARAAVVDGVLRSLGTGFVFTSHDLPDALLDEAYGMLAAFFALPSEAKARSVAPDSHGQTGYTGLLVETAAGSDRADWKGRCSTGAPRCLSFSGPIPPAAGVILQPLPGSGPARGRSSWHHRGPDNVP